MNFLRWLCLAFAVVCTIQVDPVLGDAGAYDLSNFPGCVARNKEVVEGDIPLAQLRYKSTANKETDNEDLHAAFVSRIQEKTSRKTGTVFDHYLNVTFTVYYRFDKGVYKQFASAVICEDEFGAKHNKCRNRSYFFFEHLDPITLAGVLVDDISRFTPIVRRCAWNKSP